MGGFLQMILLILIYFVVIPLIYYKILSFFLKDENDEFLSALAIHGGVLVSMTITVMTVAMLNEHYQEEHFQYSQQIVALQDNEAMVVSRYSSDSLSYYHFMVKSGEGFKSRKVRQDEAMILYTDRKAILKVYGGEPKSKILSFLSPFEIENHRYEFYLPAGSIKEEFNIDLN